MRIHRGSLLALPALLSALVVAVPSPASYLQQPLAEPPVPQVQSHSRWRSASSRLIEKAWGWGFKIKLHDIEPGPSPPEPPALGSLHITAQYGRDVVLRFNISTAEEARSLAEAADTLMLDVWEFSQNWVDIRLATDIIPHLIGLLPTTLQQSHATLLNERDLAHAVYGTLTESRSRKRTKHLQDTNALSQRRVVFGPATNEKDDSDTNHFFTDYQPLSVIKPWLQLFASYYTTHVRLISIGTSYEGREILALRVGVHPTNNEDPNPPKRKTVLITGGLHAREWIGTSTVNYIAYSLITDYGKKPEITALLENFDFVFIPTLNPDGYVYSHETDRLWRKNRQQTSVRFCRGIDLDHGFGFEWDSKGSAGNPCSEAFAGVEAFDAVEAKRLAEWARNETERNNVEFVGFLDLHSYSQQILYPYSYSCADVPPGQENLEELALGLEKAIRTTSSFSYEAMPACEGNVATAGKRTLLPMIEEGGGSALDWFYHEMHVRYAYQIKLRDRGTYGFLLPKENIVPVGKEILEAVLYFGRFLQEEVHAESRKMEDDEDWIIVEDVIDEEKEQEPRLDLRRRKR